MTALVFVVTGLVLWIVAQVQSLELTNKYPKGRSNFSYVTLICYKDRYLQHVLEKAQFLWNESNLTDAMMSVESSIPGTMTVILTQEMEGEFQCVYGGNRSKAMQLAAHPANVNMTEEINVHLHNEDEVVSRELRCGIQPGALMGKYSVQWKMISSSTDSFTVLSISQFNHSVNVSLDMNGVSCQCDVTIDHDGQNTITYNGGNFKFHVTKDSAGNRNTDSTANPNTDSAANSNGNSSVASIIVGLLIVLCVITFAIIINVAVFLRIKRRSRDMPKHHKADNLTLQKDTQMIKSRSNFHDDRINIPEIRLLPPRPYQQTYDKEPNIAVCNSEKSMVAGIEYVDDNDDDLEACSVGFISSMQLSDDISVSPNDNQFEQSASQFFFQFKSQVHEMDCLNPHCLCHNSNTQILEHAIDRENTCINPDCQCQDLRMQKLMPPVHNPRPFTDIDDNQKIPEGSDLIPSWMTKVCVLQCTEMGLEYSDESIGFAIRVPRAAVYEGVSLTIEVGVSLYGPVQYPDGVQRVSPIIWVCVREIENFHFLKSVEITIQHCLKLDATENHEALGLQFLKAGHTKNHSGNYVFFPCDGSIAPSCSTDYLTLATDHFCLLCIAARMPHETLDRTQYCLSIFNPQPFIPDENDTIHCYVSFFLNSCLETIDKRTAKSHKLIQRQKFTLNDQLGKRSLQIHYADPENWILSLQCIDEIYAEDIDFRLKEYDVLRREEEHGMYPPKFSVGITSLDGARSTKVRFCFFGANKKMATDIPLIIPGQGASPGPGPGLPLEYRNNSYSNIASAASTPGYVPYRTQSSPVPLHAFMEHVAVNIRTKWRFFGIMVEIPADVLDSFPAHDCLQCFTRVFDYWVRRGQAPVSWEAVVNVLESDTVDEKRLAADIKAMFLPSLLTVPEPETKRDNSTSGYSNNTRSSGYASNNGTDTMMVTDGVMVTDV